MKNTLVWIIGIFQLLLVLSHHRVLVIEGVSGLPPSDAYVSIERSSGDVVEVGVTDGNGELNFLVQPTFPTAQPLRTAHLLRDGLCSSIQLEETGDRTAGIVEWCALYCA